MVDRLFKAYFREGQDISNHDVLIGIASRAGMDADVTRRLLESDADMQDVRERDASARDRGVSGVPCFIIANHYVVQGAQDTAMWEKVITELSDAHEKGAGKAR